MNLKYCGIISAMAVSFAMAQEPAANIVAESAPAETAAATESIESEPAAQPAAETSAAETSAPAAEAVVEVPAEPVAEPVTAPVAAEPVAAPVAEPAADVAVAPKAVRNADAAAEDEYAPKAVRGADNTPTTVYYETVYTREDGVPVRTVYVAQRAHKDTTTLDELVGLVPMKFKLGASGSIGSYYLSGDKWDSDEYDGITWRAGLMSIIPLNEYTMGLKLGVLFEKSEASETYNYEDNDENVVPVNFRFEQMKVDIPVLFTFKGATSRFFFDLGTQVSIPVQDELNVSFTQDGKKSKSKGDMIDDGYRSSMDWSLIFGFSIMANKYLSVDIHADVGLSDLYEDYKDFVNLDLSASAFTLGVTVYPF